MIKRTLLTAMLAVGSVSAFAHDEWHGPKITKQGKYGGKLSAVIFKKDATNHHAKAQYAAEMTKSGDGKLRLYFYDTDFKPKNISATSVSGTASYKSKETRKSTDTKIEFKPSGDAFEAQLPKDIDKTVSVEVEIETKDGEYMAAFPRMR